MSGEPQAPIPGPAFAFSENTALALGAGTELAIVGRLVWNVQRDFTTEYATRKSQLAQSHPGRRDLCPGYPAVFGLWVELEADLFDDRGRYLDHHFRQFHFDLWDHQHFFLELYQRQQ